MSSLLPSLPAFKAFLWSFLTNHAAVHRVPNSSIPDQQHFCTPQKRYFLLPRCRSLNLPTVTPEAGHHPASILCFPVSQPTPIAKVWLYHWNNADQCSLFHHKFHYCLPICRLESQWSHLELFRVWSREQLSLGRELQAPWCFHPALFVSGTTTV